MTDLVTAITALYLLVDDAAVHLPPLPVRPGPAPALARSEVLTLALLAREPRFRSERAFWRFAEASLRPLFPRLPSRTAFNRAVRRCGADLTALALHLADRLGAATAPDEAIDTTAVPVRAVKRRGRSHLAGLVDIGHGGRLGWVCGGHLLVAVTPEGIVTGWGVAPASVNDRVMADHLFAARTGDVPLPSAGRLASGVYLADTGFAGRTCQRDWQQRWGAEVVAPASPQSPRRPPPRDRRRLAGRRQIVETVIGRLLRDLGIGHDRPHTLAGWLARMAAAMAMHNAVCSLNRHAGRPLLAFADLIGWA
jgi:hypothetical protein